MKDEIVKLLKEADVSKDGWECDIMAAIKDQYAKGYFACFISSWNDHDGDFHDGTLRDSLVQLCGYNLFGIK